MVDESHLKMHHNSLQHDVTAIVGSNRRLTLGKRLPRQGGNTERIVSPWGVYKNPKRWNKREHNPAVISVQVWLNSLETTADRHRGGYVVVTVIKIYHQLFHSVNIIIQSLIVAFR